MSDSVWPHGLQHLRLLCPPLSHRICSNSCPSSRWCYLITVSSATAFSFYLHSFPASESFSMPLIIRWPKYWRFNFNISPSNEYSGLISFRIDWFKLFSPRDSQKSSLVPHFETTHSFPLSLFYGPALTSIRDYWKNHDWLYGPLFEKWCLCFFIHYLSLS